MRLPIAPTAALHATALHAVVLLAITLSASACSGVEYRDSNAAVDANPLCASAPNRPGEPVSAECERTREATWSSEGKQQGEPLDFSGGGDKD
ncbi:hypothetical protein ACTJIL_15215 [Luteimonas sp. 22616]|uniref:hypothetical protein n=1 Tax=Luteimonas sp. 22616 TaxID=3453951 RepID=UPI003F85F29A